MWIRYPFIDIMSITELMSNILFRRVLAPLRLHSGTLAALLCAVSSAAWALKVTDDAGQTVSLPAVPKRIVSLAPGATEMLFAAGAGKHVIATVQYADEPAAAKQIPRIGDVVSVDMERLVALRPEVAI